MSDEGKVTTERRGHVLLIGLDRAAKRNAFSYCDCTMRSAGRICCCLGSRRRTALRGVVRARGTLHRRGLSVAIRSGVRERLDLPVSGRCAIDPLGLVFGSRMVVQAARGARCRASACTILILLAPPSYPIPPIAFERDTTLRSYRYPPPASIWSAARPFACPR